MAKKTQLKPVVKLPPEIMPRLPYFLLLPVLSVWIFFVLRNYQAKLGFFSVNPFDAPLWLVNLAEAGRLFAYLPQMAFALMFAVFALAAGGILLNIVAGEDNGDIAGFDWIVFALGLGFGALALATFGMGFLGLYNKPAVFALMGAGILAGGIRFRRDFRGRLEKCILELGQLKFSWFDKVLLLVLFLYAAAAFTWVLSPEIFFDSLVYHLGVPNYYLREGRVAVMDSNICSGFPLLVQMLYTAAIIISDDILVKLTHFAIGLFLTGTLFVMGRRYVSVTAGLLAGVIFLSMPMVVMNVTTAGMDIGSCWFTLLAAYALLLFSAREERQAPRVFDRTLLLAGIFTGLACGTKYQALFTVIAGFGVLAYRHVAAVERGDTGVFLKQTLVFGVTAGLVFLPWPLKNIFFHGNPLYPFFVKLFGGQQVDPVKWGVLLSDGFSRNFPATFSNWENLRQFVFHPWYLTFGGMGNADFIGPFILLCLPLLLLFRLKKPVFRHMAVFVAVMWLLWCVSTSMPRFFLQGLTVLSLLLAVLITRSGNGAIKWLFQILLLVVSCYTLQWLNKIAQSQDGWRVVFGLQDREAYLSLQHQTYPSPYYPAMQYINSALPADSRVLFAGETRGFYCERRFIAPSVSDVHPLVLFARASATPEDMQAKIAAAGITHIFLNLAEAMRLDKSYHLFQWDAASIRVFNAWWDRYAALAWSDVRTGAADFRLLFVYKVDVRREAAAPQTRVYNYFNDLYAKSLE